MDPIPGVDLSKAVKTADEAFAKVAAARLTEVVKSLRVQVHNLRTKQSRLLTEAAQAGASAAEVEKKLVAIAGGDWSVIDPFEMSDKAGGGEARA